MPVRADFQVITFNEHLGDSKGDVGFSTRVVNYPSRFSLADMKQVR